MHGLSSFPGTCCDSQKTANAHLRFTIVPRCSHPDYAPVAHSRRVLGLRACHLFKPLLKPLFSQPSSAKPPLANFNDGAQHPPPYSPRCYHWQLRRPLGLHFCDIHIIKYSFVFAIYLLHHPRDKPGRPPDLASTFRCVVCDWCVLSSSALTCLLSDTNRRLTRSPPGR